MFTPADFDYHLPKGRIALAPATPRDHCRLLSFNRHTNDITHLKFYELIDQLTANDVLILNETKVFPARIFGTKGTGGKVELLLLEQLTTSKWRALARPGLKPTTVLNFENNLTAVVTDFNLSTGEVDCEFNQATPAFYHTLDIIGHTPLPPYIHSSQPESQLRADYQTVYAKTQGSAAAPTAGLHFTDQLLANIKKKGITIEYITLHVGLGTFQPLRPENLQTGKLHHEWYDISPAVASRLSQAKVNGQRLIAVGTTTARTLESYAATGQLTGTTDLFIYPPFQFQLVDSLITNFHLPQSSLLMLVSAFCSQPNTNNKYTQFNTSPLGNAYHQAINDHYRFFSFGDAMWIR